MAQRKDLWTALREAGIQDEDGNSHLQSQLRQVNVALQQEWAAIRAENRNNPSNALPRLKRNSLHMGDDGPIELDEDAHRLFQECKGHRS